MPVSCVKRCQAGVSATSRSLVQRSPTKCGVSECDGGISQRSSIECGVSESDRETSQRSSIECGVSESDRRTSQRSPIECGVSESDRGTSQMSPTECGVSGMIEEPHRGVLSSVGCLRVIKEPHRRVLSSMVCPSAIEEPHRGVLSSVVCQRLTTVTWCFHEQQKELGSKESANVLLGLLPKFEFRLSLHILQNTVLTYFSQVHSCSSCILEYLNQNILEEYVAFYYRVFGLNFKDSHRRHICAFCLKQYFIHDGPVHFDLSLWRI